MTLRSSWQAGWINTDLDEDGAQKNGQLLGTYIFEHKLPQKPPQPARDGLKARQRPRDASGNRQRPQILSKPSFTNSIPKTLTLESHNWDIVGDGKGRRPCHLQIKYLLLNFVFLFCFRAGNRNAWPGSVGTSQSSDYKGSLSSPLPCFSSHLP